MSQPHGVDISGVPQSAEKRHANDGAWYTHAEFASHYKEQADWYWMRAGTQTAPDVSGGSHPAAHARFSTWRKAVQIVYSASEILTWSSRGPYQASKYFEQTRAHRACTCLLKNVPNTKGIDVTDGVGFPWQSSLRTQPAGRQIIGPGVYQVCVVPRAKGPSLAFFRSDGSTCILTPRNMPYDVPPYEVLSTADAGQCAPTHHAECSWTVCPHSGYPPVAITSCCGRACNTEKRGVSMVDSDDSETPAVAMVNAWELQECKCKQPSKRMALVSGEETYRCFECLKPHPVQTLTYELQIPNRRTELGV